MNKSFLIVARLLLSLSLLLTSVTSYATLALRAPNGSTFRPPELPGSLKRRVHAGAYETEEGRFFVSHISVESMNTILPILYNEKDSQYQILMNVPELNGKWLHLNVPFDQQVTADQKEALSGLSYTATAVNEDGTIVGYGGYFKRTDKKGDGVWVVAPVIRKATDTSWTPLIDKYADGAGSCSIPTLISQDSGSVFGVAVLKDVSESGKLVSWSVDSQKHSSQTTIDMDKQALYWLYAGDFQHLPFDWSPDLNTIGLNLVETNNRASKALSW